MRFNKNARTFEEVLEYYTNRSVQLAHVGVKMGNIAEIPEGVWVEQTVDWSDEKFYSLYVYEQFRGNGIYHKLYLDKCEQLGYRINIITSTNCGLADYLAHKNIPHLVVDGLIQTPEYKLIEAIYGDNKAERSGVYLMNHIDEGLYILYKINARTKAKLAYILHPIFQGDSEIVNNITRSDINNLDVKAVILAIEYRHIANDYLSKRTINSLDEIRLSPLDSVNNMLIADKIQNRKDFELYHLGVHARSNELDEYFKNWMKRLSIDEDKYQNFKNELIKFHNIK